MSKNRSHQGGWTHQPEVIARQSIGDMLKLQCQAKPLSTPSVCWMCADAKCPSGPAPSVHDCHAPRTIHMNGSLEMSQLRLQQTRGCPQVPHRPHGSTTLSWPRDMQLWRRLA
eukprot:1224167-Amphidinium_carterae.1